MQSHKYLRWTLTIIAHLGHDRLTLKLVQLMKVGWEVPLVGCRLEEIIRNLGFVPVLTDSKHQVDPLRQIRGDLVAFESTSHLQNEILVILCPVRQTDVSDLLF